MMIRRFMLLITIIIVLWNGNMVQREAKWLLVEMDMDMELISYTIQQM